MYANEGLAPQLTGEPHSSAKPPWRETLTKNTKEHPSVKNKTREFSLKKKKQKSNCTFLLAFLQVDSLQINPKKDVLQVSGPDLAQTSLSLE